MEFANDIRDSGPLLRQRYPDLHPRPRIGDWRTGRNIRYNTALVEIEFYIYTIVEEIIYRWRDRDLLAATGCKIIILVEPAIGCHIIPDLKVHTEVDLVLQFLIIPLSG